MPPVRDNAPPTYLTTKEVAKLLRVKERKVYDLAAAGVIPCRRITGKLLFPNAEVLAWIEGSGQTVSRDPPAVLAGSHDPLLDWAVRESECGLATLLNGSLDGLSLFADGQAALSGMHIPDADGWNIETVAARGLRNCVLISWAVRKRGLLLSGQVQDRVRRFADLRGMRVALRQPGAGAATLFEMLLKAEGLTADDLAAPPGLARTESDAAAAVAAGEADATIGIEAMARRFSLGFLPLVDERFDLLVDRRAYFSEPVQSLLVFARGEGLRGRAESMGGYDLADTGATRWVSP